jgi:hypothetical protein
LKLLVNSNFSSRLVLRFYSRFTEPALQLRYSQQRSGRARVWNSFHVSKERPAIEAISAAVAPARAG